MGRHANAREADEDETRDEDERTAHLGVRCKIWSMVWSACGRNFAQALRGWLDGRDRDGPSGVKLHLDGESGRSAESRVLDA
jgi:hypothetical protein